MKQDHVICAECGEEVHIHMYWLGNDGKKYHFNCLPQDRKDELAAEGVTSDNGSFLLGVLDAIDKHGVEVFNE